MSWRTVTALVIVATFVVWVAYDIVAAATYGNEATISRLCLETADRNRGFVMIVCLLLGILLGHLFLPQHVATK